MNELDLRILMILPTHRLLDHYRKERKKYFQFRASSICECCGERKWDLYPESYKNEEQNEKNWKKYLEFVLQILDTREHIK